VDVPNVKSLGLKFCVLSLRSLFLVGNNIWLYFKCCWPYENSQNS